MKAIICKETGLPEVLSYEEVPMPKPRKNQILVKIHYSGVNFIDVYFRNGVYPVTDFPFISGKEGSGEVIETGKDCKIFKQGDRIAFPFGGTGTYAEYCVLNEDEVAKLPDSMGYDIGAAIMLQGLTAHYLSISTYPVKKNDLVLLHSGAGGVGILLTQMCKNLGAKVITTVSTEVKKQKSLNAGADEVILYENYQFKEKFLSLTCGEKAQVVYDSVAKETFEQSLGCLEQRGMLVLYGNSSGVVPPFQLNRLNSLGSLYVTRPSLAAYLKNHSEFVSRTSALFSQIESGKLIPNIGNVYPLADAAKSHRDLESRKTTGKNLLKIL